MPRPQEWIQQLVDSCSGAGGGLDQDSSCRCGEQWVDLRGILEECQQDQCWMGRQEEMSLVTFDSPSPVGM